jgi:hypothetical protein
MTQCNIHNVEMKQYWKKDDVNKTGDSWHSHKLANGDWCNGKPPKTQSAERPQLEAKVLATLNAKLDILTKKVDDTLKRVDWLYRKHPEHAPKGSKPPLEATYGPDTTGYAPDEGYGHVEDNNPPF